MDDAEKYILRQQIASILDHPSVYMGGPSPNSVRRAVGIVELLLREYTIEPTEIIKPDAERVRTWRVSPWDSPARIWKGAAVKLSAKRLDQLALVAKKDAIWINSSHTAWPDGDHPKWALEQFSVAKELIRLAIIGLAAEKPKSWGWPCRCCTAWSALRRGADLGVGVSFANTSPKGELKMTGFDRTCVLWVRDVSLMISGIALGQYSAVADKSVSLAVAAMCAGLGIFGFVSSSYLLRKPK
jgi:hypothetical protein